MVLNMFVTTENLSLVFYCCDCCGETAGHRWEVETAIPAGHVTRIRSICTVVALRFVFLERRELNHKQPPTKPKGLDLRMMKTMIVNLDDLTGCSIFFNNLQV